jgi:hypothetical protein
MLFWIRRREQPATARLKATHSMLGLPQVDLAAVAAFEIVPFAFTSLS